MLLAEYTWTETGKFWKNTCVLDYLHQLRLESLFMNVLSLKNQIETCKNWLQSEQLFVWVNENKFW